jgi:hypothetical protein
MGKHHLRKCDGMRPDVLCLGKIYIVRVHERLLPPPAFAECCQNVTAFKPLTEFTLISAGARE